MAVTRSDHGRRVAGTSGSGGRGVSALPTVGDGPGWCICAVMNRLKRWLARRPVGRANVRRARVRALAVLLVTAAAALVLAVLSHQGWPPVVVGIVGTLPA